MFKFEWEVPLGEPLTVQGGRGGGSTIAISVRTSIELFASYRVYTILQSFGFVTLESRYSCQCTTHVWNDLRDRNQWVDTFGGVSEKFLKM